MHRWIVVGGGAATRAAMALVFAGGCLGAAAYAATSWGESPAATARPAGPRPPRPLITRHPEKVSTSATVSFAFRAARGEPRFQCRLDRDRWRACRAPLVLRGLAPGDHRFSVRALSRRGRRGAAARFAWKLLEPRPLGVEADLASLGALYPGAAPQVLPVVLRNPNPVPVLVTALAAAAADAPGCDSAANLELTPSSISPAAPLTLPAGGAASLPAPGVAAPAIALRDLPVNQDACQGARIPLTFSAEAHG